MIKTNIPTIPVPLQAQPANDRAEPHNVQQAAAQAHTHPSQRVKAMGGGATQQRLLGKIKKQAAPATSDNANAHADVNMLATEALMSPSEGTRELARSMVPPETHVGPNGHTFARECELFGGMQRPGFQAQHTADTDTTPFLTKIFGANSVAGMADKFLTAATRVGSSLHDLTQTAAKHGYAPPSLLAAAAAEQRLFPGLRVGF